MSIGATIAKYATLYYAHGKGECQGFAWMFERKEKPLRVQRWVLVSADDIFLG